MSDAVLMLGNCLDTLKDLPDNSVDSIVTDPPYGLSFMGKAWDYEVPSEEIWREALRVLKPGGYLLSFFGTRTYHRGVIKIEDAGFEIRDQIMWIYGSGFPKSTDVSKRIDKEAGAERKNIGDVKRSGSNSRAFQSEDKTTAGQHFATAPSTDEAKQWQGWGSALKPANEPIVVARKPLEKGLTLAQNVLKYGTGAINVDESRIETNDNLNGGAYSKETTKEQGSSYTLGITGKEFSQPQGRWPANIIFDEAAAELLDVQQADVSRFFYVAKASKSERNAGLEGMPLVESGVKNDSGRGFSKENPYKEVLNQNFHPTVKPIKLMQYLIKLVTPPDGITLDPFMGSGSTGVAAISLGFNFIGCEMSQEYMQIAEKRIDNAKK